MSSQLVTMTGISKRYPGVLALDNANFDLKAGEVHALVGENGAGKSTMMKILSGIVTEDSGKILLEGKAIRLHGPRSAQDLGISIIHQELNLMPDLTIAQNIFIGREPRRFKFILNDSGLVKEAEKLFAELHLNLDPNRKVEGLSVAQQQLVEIVKALSYNSRVLIMDEPTAALGVRETAKVEDLIKRMKAQGLAILLISHNFDQVLRLSDQIWVMRQGDVMAGLRSKDTSGDELVALITGAKSGKG